MTGQQPVPQPGPDPAPDLAPAFYANPRLLARSRLREWWNILHPPYTLWHLSYVVIGACFAPNVDGVRLIATMLAFFLAVGVAAHALDELNGRPLRSSIPAAALVAASVFGIAGAVAIGLAGVTRVGVGLLAFIVIGPVLAVGYNLELWGGRLHTDAMFAAAWGAFPVVTAYFAQHERLSPTVVPAAAFAFFLSLAQRQLSSPARLLRRTTAAVHGTLMRTDGTESALGRATLLGPLEAALRAMTLAIITLAATLAYVRLGP